MLAQAYAVLLTACHTMRVRPYTPSAMLLQKLHGRLQPPEKILGRRERARLISPQPALPLHHPAATACAHTRSRRHGRGKKESGRLTNTIESVHIRWCVRSACPSCVVRCMCWQCGCVVRAGATAAWSFWQRVSPFLLIVRRWRRRAVRSLFFPPQLQSMSELEALRHHACSGVVARLCVVWYDDIIHSAAS